MRRNWRPATDWTWRPGEHQGLGQTPANELQVVGVAYQADTFQHQIVVVAGETSNNHSRRVCGSPLGCCSREGRRTRLAGFFDVPGVEILVADQPQPGSR